jgi:hypothetical protein
LEKFSKQAFVFMPAQGSDGAGLILEDLCVVIHDKNNRFRGFDCRSRVLVVGRQGCLKILPILYGLSF